jgi:hypothetical protein
VSFVCVLFYTIVSIGHVMGDSILLGLEGACFFSLSLYRMLFVLTRFVIFFSRLWSASSLPPRTIVFTVGLRVLVL